MTLKTRTTPNPNSEIIANAHIGGCGLTLPPSIEAPEGMAAVVLFVPMQHILGKSPIEIQKDVGLPWASSEGAGIWFDDFE